MRRLIWVLLVFVVCSEQLSEARRWRCKWPDEHPGRLMIGLRLGAAYSSIGNLESVLESGNKKPNYTWDEDMYVLPTAELFTEYKVDRIAGEFGVGYYSQGAYLTKDVNDGRLVEEYDFYNHYLSLALAFRIYTYEGLYTGLCGRFGILISPSEIKYASSKYASYESYDSRVADQLNETIQGKNEFGAGFMLGYLFENGLSVEMRYYLGLNDMQKTYENDYGYTERDNLTNWVCLTIGYSVTIFDNIKKNKKCPKHKLRPFWKH